MFFQRTFLQSYGDNKRQERRREVNEMKMRRWMSGVTKNDKIQNEDERGPVKMASVQQILQRKV